MEFEQENSTHKKKGGGAVASPPPNVGWQLLTSATKRKKSLKNMLFYNRIWSWKKWREKRGEGYWKKLVLPYVFKNYVFFFLIQVYTMSEKNLKHIQNKFCCLKKIICTRSCTRLWHQGIIAISCRIWKQKFRFLEKKMCLMY